MSEAVSRPTPARFSPRSLVSDAADSLDVFQIVARQRWLIGFLTMLGFSIGVLYAIYAQDWYESRGKVLINQRTAGLGSPDSNTGTDMVEEDVLANHMELLKSRMIVEDALRQSQLMELPSVQPHLKPDLDAIDYVIENISLARGGDGAAKTARTLEISLAHTDPEDTKTLLTAVLKRYEKFIVDQVDQVMGRANELVQQARSEVETDLVAAEQDYLKSRQNAPLFFQGEGSSNVYQERYRRLQDEMLDIDIQESTVRTRLSQVEKTLGELDASGNPIDNLDKLALIDSESLERLGVFAGLQMSASNSAEFKAAMPAMAEEARTQITHLLQLNSEKQRLNAVFGAGHPKVADIENEITLVKQFLQDNESSAGTSAMFGDSTLSAEGLLKAYVGFLQHDLSALSQRREELTFLASDAEAKAKTLIEYELNDLVLQKKIERQEALFDGLVSQLRELDTSSALSGYLYEFLEVPRLGEKVWPKLPLCALGGLMLGMFGGLSFAIANDVRDGRFRSAAELDEAIQLPSLGMVDKLNAISQGVKGLIATENSPNAEAFRLGRTIMLPEIRANKLRTIGFTSPMQADGKSTITSNFAVSFSQVGLKVLVIDADLRRPSQHKYFSIQKDPGLCDLLENKIEFSEAIKSTDAEGVFVISAGASTRNPAELLQSERFDEILHQAKQEFDLVLVDLPPVLAVSDPVVVLPRLDGGVLVVKVASVRRDEVVNTMRRIEGSGGNFIGCMLNAYGSGQKFNTAGGYYGYYRSDYTKSKNAVVAKPAISRAEASVVNGKHDG